MPKQTQNVNTHLSKIARINALLAVCVLACVVAVYAWMKWGLESNSIVTNANTNTQSARNANVNTTPTAEETAALTTEYQNGVQAAVQGIDLTNTTQVQTAIAAVTALRVPADLRAFQVQLLAALQVASAGETDNANERFAELHAQYSWFTE